MKKRSRSGSPERKLVRSSVSRSGLISIRAHQVPQRLSGGSGGTKPLYEVIERFPRQHDARRNDRVRGQLLQRAQVVSKRRFDQMALLDPRVFHMSLEQIFRLFRDRSGNLDCSSHDVLSKIILEKNSEAVDPVADARQGGGGGPPDNRTVAELLGTRRKARATGAAPHLAVAQIPRSR